MVVRDNKRIKVKRLNETRSSGISVMIEEGGLGADQYYQIEKQNAKTSEEHLHQFEHELTEMTNVGLIDLLTVNAQESTNKDYSEALKAIQLEVLHRMES
ncbi:hypothetical protein CD110_05885 [Staphylococcus casei]|uniref:Uncharacterized protein n=2 Tax=Staphylococcus TaxID=1279 RepID=A0A9Q6HQF8_9STAP|nr:MULTISPECIES: hypothetical protein [Staphylococcus]MBU0438946.1 hypothetical protein [Staphylococcus succinus]MDH9159783.1 hypothetical protein [Staphylococcus succinus]MEB7463154.1 hypothetical protein [Staphylococcus succinus]MEB8124015.1 hypothetical protein [Staphylococcus succinus]MEB8127771.1 hypothetical protein [Staphylococcus succinus]